MKEWSIHSMECALVALITVALGFAMAERSHVAQARTEICGGLYAISALEPALEAYRVDWDSYPLCNTFGSSSLRHSQADLDPRDRVLERLSTPIAYLANPFFEDPTHPTTSISIAQHSDLPGERVLRDRSLIENRLMYFTSWDAEGRAVVPSSTTPFGDGVRAGQSWLLQVAGPDQSKYHLGAVLSNFTADESFDLIYDPTNGTRSAGALFRVGGDAGQPGDYGHGFFRAMIGRCPELIFEGSGLGFQ